MTTVNVTDKIKLEFKKHATANVGTYSPIVLTSGGEKRRNPKTGEEFITEDRWVEVPLFFTNLAHALRWCAQENIELCAQEQQHTGESISLDDYITRCEAVWKS